MKLGAARVKVRAAWRLIDLEMAEKGATFTFALNRDKLGKTRRREGRYLLRTNLCAEDPAFLYPTRISRMTCSFVRCSIS